MSSRPPCSKCGSDRREPGQKHDDAGRPLDTCATCGHVDGRPISAAPTGDPLFGAEGCYRVEPHIPDE